MLAFGLSRAAQAIRRMIVFVGRKTRRSKNKKVPRLVCPDQAASCGGVSCVLVLMLVLVLVLVCRESPHS